MFNGGIFDFGDSDYIYKLLPSQENVGKEINAILVVAKMLNIGYIYIEGRARSNNYNHLNIIFSKYSNTLGFNFTRDGYITKLTTIIKHNIQEYTMKEYELALKNFRENFYKDC